MASIKVKFRESTVQNKEGVIYYQLIHNKTVRQIGVGYRLFPTEFNEENSQVVISTTNKQRIQYLTIVRDRIKLDLVRLAKIIAALDSRSGSYSVEDIIKSFEKQLKGETLINFMQGVITRLRELHKERTSETYLATLNSFMKFREGEDVLLTDISSDMMLSYEAYLKYSGVSMNTISFYMRILRAVYNRAVERELIQQQNPFKRVYTGVDKTVKRALSLGSLKQIKELDLMIQPKLEFARDMFLFSFYTRGMSFVDMAYLRKKDLQNGVLSYRRRKTGQQLHIKWEACMQKIIDKYENTETPYLLPIIKKVDTSDRLQYKSGLYIVNNNLKKIATMIEITIPLTMYVARHSWASIARSKNIPISVISEGMGHDSESTTQIYLASLDTAVVDRANNLILKLI